MRGHENPQAFTDDDYEVVRAYSKHLARFETWAWQEFRHGNREPRFVHGLHRAAERLRRRLKQGPKLDPHFWDCGCGKDVADVADPCGVCARVVCHEYMRICMGPVSGCAGRLCNQHWNLQVKEAVGGRFTTTCPTCHSTVQQREDDMAWGFLTLEQREEFQKRGQQVWQQWRQQPYEDRSFPWDHETTEVNIDDTEDLAALDARIRDAEQIMAEAIETDQMYQRYLQRQRRQQLESPSSLDGAWAPKTKRGVRK